MELISLTKMSYNYIDQGNREVNNGRAAEAEMFKMGARPDPPGTRSWNLPADQSAASILGTQYLISSRPNW